VELRRIGCQGESRSAEFRAKDAKDAKGWPSSLRQHRSLRLLRAKLSAEARYGSWESRVEGRHPSIPPKTAKNLKN